MKQPWCENGFPANQKRIFCIAAESRDVMDTPTTPLHHCDVSYDVKKPDDIIPLSRSLRNESKWEGRGLTTGAVSTVPQIFLFVLHVR
jgi:hypothetical protein